MIQNTMRPSRQGGWIVLGAAIIAAILFSVAAFAALSVGLSGRQRSLQITEGRLRAQYAAEAGLVWAAQRLWADPDILVNPVKCFSANPDFSLDTDGPGPLPPTAVDITASPCPSAATTLKAKVTY